MLPLSNCGIRLNNFGIQQNGTVQNQNGFKIWSLETLFIYNQKFSFLVLTKFGTN
jgi:hypothetical protein